MAQITRKQHYVPRSSLIHFKNNDDRIMEALLESGRINPVRPEDSMCQRDVYENDNLPTNAFEEYFQRIEDVAAPKINTLKQFLESCTPSRDELSEARRKTEELIETFIIYYYRSGALLTEFSSLSPEEKVSNLAEKILHTTYIKALSNLIKNSYKFGIIKSNGDFLISDQNISTCALRIKSQFFDISNRHIGLKETCIFIPVSSSFYIVYWHSDGHFFVKENAITELTEEELLKVNQAIINNSYKKCAGAKETRLREALTGYTHEFPSQMYVGYGDNTFGGSVNKKEVFFHKIDKDAFRYFSSGIRQYQNCERNTRCPCGSEKKYKKCHEEVITRIKGPIENLIASKQGMEIQYHIPNVQLIELPVVKWGN